MNLPRTIRTLACALLAIVLTRPATSAPIGTAFTFQGRFERAGSPYTGHVNFTFVLYDAASGGSILGPVQTVNGVIVNNGMFTVTLDFGNVFSGAARWLDVSAQAEIDPTSTPLVPRQMLSPVPYAMFAVNGGGGGSLTLPYQGNTTSPSSSAFVILNQASSGNWNAIEGHQYSGGGGSGVYGVSHATTGYVAGVTGDALSHPSARGVLGLGLGTGGEFVSTAPASASATAQAILGSASNVPAMRGNSTNADAIIGTSGSQRGVVGSSPNTGVNGITTIGRGVEGDASSGTGVAGYSQSGDGLYGSSQSGIGIRGFSANTTGIYGVSNNAAGVHGHSVSFDGVWGQCQSAGRSGVYGFNSNASGYGGTFRNTGGGVALFADGLAQVRTLQILGGADLAEPFDVAGEGTSSPEAGSVLVIDPARPGELRVSDQPYDLRVAGVVSGANQLAPGLVMQSDAEHAHGRHPVALTGRVWCKADARFGAIHPGDLLVTSPTPGHAMRADDSSRRGGAVLGKAMTSLEGGRGLVLVLVSLQ